MFCHSQRKIFSFVGLDLMPRCEAVILLGKPATGNRKLQDQIAGFLVQVAEGWFCSGEQSNWRATTRLLGWFLAKKGNQKLGCPDFFRGNQTEKTHADTYVGKWAYKINVCFMS